jgi:putative tryptophan/tyrosine transport system substrate-binding protein
MRLRRARGRKTLVLLFLVAATLGAAAGTSAAQESVKRIAILGPAEEPRFSEVGRGLRRGLGDRGYSEGALEIIPAKVARGDHAGARAAVAGLVRQGVQVLFAIGSELARVARQVSLELPIVFVTPGDPVAAGLVGSLAHPGGNMTAMTFEFPELSAKRLELLKELSPRIRKVLVLYDPRDASPNQGIAAARAGAASLAITLIEREARNDDDVMLALVGLTEADAVLAIPGGITSAHYAAISRAANANRLPTLFHARSESTMDALASYGASDANMAREAARLVDKILKGENAGDLPVERPTKFELVINLKTAKALGLEVPATLLARADEVIE